MRFVTISHCLIITVSVQEKHYNWSNFDIDLNCIKGWPVKDEFLLELHNANVVVEVERVVVLVHDELRNEPSLKLEMSLWSLINNLIEWQTVNMTFLSIPQGVILTGEPPMKWYDFQVSYALMNHIAFF